jgi:hypothetical protein
MDYRLRHQPWTEGSLIPEDEFLGRVKAALESEGRWETYGEYRMGAGPTVSITAVPHGSQTTYLAVAKWMDWALTLAGEYDDLDLALAALPMFGDALYEVLSAGGNEGLVDSD